MTTGTGSAALSGYVGLITVPVAYNCYEKAPEAAKAAMASFLTQFCHSLKRPQTMCFFMHIRRIEPALYRNFLCGIIAVSF